MRRLRTDSRKATDSLGETNSSTIPFYGSATVGERKIATRPPATSTVWTVAAQKHAEGLRDGRPATQWNAEWSDRPASPWAARSRRLSFREWEQWADTNNPRSLYIPQLGYRRETTWDYHGEVYIYQYQCPDVWVRVHLKNPGLWRVSLYFFNKDGHSGANLQRDYPVEVYSAGSAFAKASTVPLLTARAFPTNHGALAWAKWAMRTKPLAEGRVVNFWGGVYLRFALAGPGQYMIRLDRNASLDTIVQAVFIDPEIAKPDLFTDRPMNTMGGVQYQPPAMPADPSNTLAPAISLWQAAQHAFGPRGGAHRRFARLLCYRFAFAHHAPAKLLANWRWHLDLWTRGDRKVFDHTMNKAFRARLKGWKGLRQFMAKNGELQSNSGEMGHD